MSMEVNNEKLYEWFFFLYIKTTSYNFQNEIAGESYIIIYEGGITTSFKGDPNYPMK